MKPSLTAPPLTSALGPSQVIKRSGIDLCTDDTRPSNNAWDPAGRMVGGTVLHINTEVTRIFSVICGNSDRGVVVNTSLSKRLDYRRSHMIDVVDRGVITVELQLQYLGVSACNGDRA